MDFKIEKASQYSVGVVIDKPVEFVYSYNYPVDEPIPDMPEDVVAGSWASPEPVSKVLKVKDWKRRNDYERNAQEYLRASQYMRKISPEDKLQEFFESKGIDKIDSDEYDKL